MPLEKFGSGSPLQSLLRFAPLRIFTSILHASQDFDFKLLILLTAKSLGLLQSTQGKTVNMRTVLLKQVQKDNFPLAPIQAISSKQSGEIKPKAGITIPKSQEQFASKCHIVRNK